MMGTATKAIYAGDEASRASLRPLKGVQLIRGWLLLVAGMVYAMILVGGATRLTDSGLSITEWKPLLGAIPPLNDSDWETAFQQYQTMTTQYHQLNAGMAMAEFKSIYWWEWGHRELGRLIGAVFLLPLLAFWFTGRLTKRLAPLLVMLFALGALQGAIGWWMVASGVGTDLAYVAPYRLMIHFNIALLIIAFCFWLWLQLGPAVRTVASGQERAWAGAALAIAATQMALGALVAGLHAGRGYTDWPLMGGRLVPEALFALSPWWTNFLENEATVQFFHRATAYALLAISGYCAWRFWRSRNGFVILALLTTGQAILGVVTLLNAAPLSLALAHQALGTMVLLAAVSTFWRVSGARHYEATTNPATA